MIKKHSDDPDVKLAAAQSHEIITEILSKLPQATSYDYGGQDLEVGEYEVCKHCTIAIAEAQQAQKVIEQASDATDDPLIKEHLDIVAKLFKQEADAAVIRAELHNGKGTEAILNTILRYNYDRNINESYQHSHHQGK